MKNKIFFIVISAMTFFSMVPERLRAQEDFEDRKSIKPVTRKATTAAAIRTTTVTKVQKVYVPVEKIKTVKISSLTVTTQSGAEVVLKSNAGFVAKKIAVASEGSDGSGVPNKYGVAVFENLKPTTAQLKYEIAVSLDGYQAQNQDEVEIPQQQTSAMSFDLKPITYQLEVETNINEGEVRFAPARVLEKLPSGVLRTGETGSYCIAPIKNKRAVISDLKKGYYNLDIRPKELEYVPTKVVASIGLDSDDADRSQTYEVNVEKKISTDRFDAAWTTDSWVMPAGWRVADSRMSVSGAPGVALPKNEQFRYYHNFEMTADARMTDGSPVGFAFRAEDTKNYYLIQISGANSSSPYMVSGYLIRNDIPTPLLSSPISHLAKMVAPGKSFRIHLKAVNNVFTVSLEDSDTGQVYDIGNMTDRDDYFKKGAIGIASRGGNNFDVLLLSISSLP